MSQVRREGGRIEFHIGKIDVYEAVQHAQGGNFLISGYVGSDGDLQPSVPGALDAACCFRRIVHEGHEIDVMDSGILQHKVAVCKFFCRHGLSFSRKAVRDHVVLAEDAAQGTAFEEYGARAAPARNDRFLAVVGRDEVHLRKVRGLAETKTFAFGP